ncbi:MAG: hypothetical protein ACFE8N_11180, partial [Promethearchaeota archaeon]
MHTSRLLGLRQIKAISDYQFGKNITDVLFDDLENIRIERSRSTNKIRYIYYQNDLILTLRPTNGFFTLTFYSANKIIKEIVP